MYELHPEEIESIVRMCIDKVSRRRKVQKYRRIAASVSQNLVIPVFFSLSFGGDPHGIFRASPFEVLHTFLIGMMKYTLFALFEYTVLKRSKDGTMKKCKRFNNVKFERRLRSLSLHSKRQSDRNMPRCSFNCGVTKLRGLNGQEYVGLSMLTIAALPGMLRNEALEKQFSLLLWRGVSLYTHLTRDSYSIIDLAVLESHMKQYLHQFKDVVGPQRWITSPKVGTKLVKFHGCLKFVEQIPWIGSPENWNGVYLESALKTFVKHPAKRTSKKHSSFSNELVQRWSEYSSIEQTAHSLHLIGDGSDNDEDLSLASRPRRINNRSKPGVSRAVFRFEKIGRTWHTCWGRNNIVGQIQHPYEEWDDVLLKAVKSFLNERNVPHIVACHYEMRIRSVQDNKTEIFRANPKYGERSWYDWMNVEYKGARDTTYLSPSQVFLFMSCRLQDKLNATDRVYALVRSFHRQGYHSYPNLKVWNGDNLHDDAVVIDFKNSVKSVAYVLPGISPTLDSDIEDFGKRNHYFLSIPPQSDWHKLGWDDDNGDNNPTEALI